MATSPRTTSRDQPRPAPRNAAKQSDPLTWLYLAVFAALLITPVVVARHGNLRTVIVPFLFLAIAVAAAPLADAVEGRSRGALATGVFLAGMYGAAITWQVTFPFAIWMLPGLAIVWGVVVIGSGSKRSASKVRNGRRARAAIDAARAVRPTHAPTAPPRARAERRARHRIAMAAAPHLPPETEWGDLDVSARGITRARFFLPSGTVGLGKNGRAELARNVATDMTLPRGMVTVEDLGEAIAEGWYQITVREHRAWAGPRDETDHPDLIGHDADGAAVLYDARVEGAEMVLVTGGTGMGKSNLIKRLMGVHYQRGCDLRIIDAKGGASLFEWREHGAWAVDEISGGAIIEDVANEVVRRNLDNGRLGRPFSTEQPIALIVDEVDAVIDEPGVAGAWKTILKRGRSANVKVVAGTVSARVDVLGGGDVKAQFVGLRCAFHTDTDEENRVALGVVAPGFRTNVDLTADDLGRCVVRNFPGRDLFFMHCAFADPPPPLDPGRSVSPPAPGRPPIGAAPDGRDRQTDRPTDRQTGPTERPPAPSRDRFDAMLASIVDHTPRTVPQLTARMSEILGRGVSKNTVAGSLRRLAEVGRAKEVQRGRHPAWVNPVLEAVREVVDAPQQPNPEGT